MKHIICFLAISLFVAPLSLLAQTAEMTLPDAITVQPGKLVITFKDGVTEAFARDWVAESSLKIDKVQFEDVLVTLSFAEPVSMAELDAIRASTEVISVEMHDLPGNIQSTQDSGIQSRQQVAVLLQPHIANGAAMLHVKQFLRTPLSYSSVKKIPNDIEISVPEGEEEAILERLERSEWVKYVSYLSEVNP